MFWLLSSCLKRIAAVSFRGMTRKAQKKAVPKKSYPSYSPDPKDRTAAVEKLDPDSVTYLFNMMTHALGEPEQEQDSLGFMVFVMEAMARTARLGMPHNRKFERKNVQRIEPTKLPDGSNEHCKCGKFAEFVCKIEYKPDMELEDEEVLACGVCAGFDVLAESNLDRIGLEKHGDVIRQYAWPK